MILQALVDYYEALAEKGEISRPGWCTEKVSFALNISPEGELLDVIPLSEQVQRNKKMVDVPRIMEVPERVVRSSGIKSNFLCDNTGYILGFDEKGNPERTKDCFASCRDLHLSILEKTKGVSGTAVKAFFLSWNPESVNEHPVLAPHLNNMKTVNIVFKIDGSNYAHDDDEVKKAWHEYCTSDNNTIETRCLVTGKVSPVESLHGKIKGIPGAQSAGANLISFNADAYESYGKGSEKSPNAPVSKYAAFSYVTALNRLISDSRHKQQIGDTTVIYWAEEADPKPPQLFTSVFALPNADDEYVLHGVINNISKGKPVDGVDLNKRFYILGLSPNAARISVRFFLQDSFGAFLENLSKHYERLEITKPSFDPREYLSISALLGETVNPNSRDKASSPLMSGSVMRAVLTGTSYPISLYQAILGRIRAERKITRGKAAIIKAYLLKINQTNKEVLTMALNESSENKAYVLGRLFAVLENAQQQANPGINTTIKDRYFTSACATPSSVFPRLLQLANHHIAKSDYGYAREKEISSLLNKLEVDDKPFPTHLSLNDQGVFILGYYHQTQARYTKKEGV